MYIYLAERVLKNDQLYFVNVNFRSLLLEAQLYTLEFYCIKKPKNI